MNLFSGKEGIVWWQGVVEDVNDPEALGRVRVRIFGFHSDDRSKIPTETLPWASPIMPITSASIMGIGQSPTGALPGAWVMGFFRDGMTAQDPIIWGTVYGKPGDSAIGAPDGSYPSSDEFTPGASVQGDVDVNKLATGVGPEESNDADGAASSDNSSGDGDRAIDQSGTANDKENKKRLSKITSKNGNSTYVATIFKDNFQNFINELERTPTAAFPTGYSIYSLGGYVYRKSAAGNGSWSYHASGVSIDINPAENPYGKKMITDMPDGVSAMAKKYGLGWGGDWNSSKDAMHFSMASKERGSVKLKRNGIVPDPATGKQDGVASTPSVNPSSKYTNSSAAKLGSNDTFASKYEGDPNSVVPWQNPDELVGRSPTINAIIPKGINVQEWAPNTSYKIGDRVRSPMIPKTDDFKNLSLRSGVILSANSLGVSAVDLATVISYETGGSMDPRKVGRASGLGIERGLLQLGDSITGGFGGDFSTFQSAIDTQLDPSAGVVSFLKAQGVGKGSGVTEIFAAVNNGKMAGKYYDPYQAVAGSIQDKVNNLQDYANFGSITGTIEDKVSTLMGGHASKAMRLLDGKMDVSNIQQKVYDVVSNGISSALGTGPVSSMLTDGLLGFKQAPDAIQAASALFQNDALESLGALTLDGYSTVGSQYAGGTPALPKPFSVTQKTNQLTQNALFAEPDSPFKAEYPHNKVLFTESGHIQEFDDTPGAERIHTQHRSGTFEEIHPDGSRVVKIVKDNYTIVLGNDSIHVTGNLNLVVDANVTVKIAGKVNVDVGQTIDTKSGGNTTIKAPEIHLNP